jgi:hypothetical protein
MAYFIRPLLYLQYEWKVAKKNRGDKKKKDKFWKWKYSKETVLFRVQILTLFGTLVALFFTYKAIRKTGEANKISADAFAYTQSKDSENNARQIIIDKENRIKDSESNKSFERSLVIADSNTKISLDALKETQKRFEIENKPFIRIIPTTPDVTKPCYFRYLIVNYGKMPIIVTYTHGGITYGFVNGSLLTINF